MELTPHLYHWFIRPKWITKKYVHNLLTEHVHFSNKSVLDFGAGTGANSVICEPSGYLGLDLNKKRIEFAKRNYPNYRFNVINGSLSVIEQSFDVIMIVAVLHHISPKKVSSYVKEFRKALKPNGGRIIVIEPCFFENTPISNRFMHKNDNGKYIQYEQDYLNFFLNEGFQCKVMKRYSKCLFYNELFFIAY
ncbi:bifunctional 2-polyprenyl-6-hydroxyphenol methylase/3-demethylubiquinol 3-O-methyltransferase UbiG [Alteribacillus sp. YIM 98480]|uniref:class I SAM-dependent methyltransferase n=1 Tax=Alteribacillus sp. YIM 98480 TaxID=2606599 RepID=UPI00131D40D0|nr:class I SAM-dependent methyltransferase [Alteribacillus sp. YIM 98480]